MRQANMSTSLESYVNQTVSIVTNDGRIIVGMLKGFDQTVNVILENSHERVYSSASGVEQVSLGLYIIRGDNMSDLCTQIYNKCDMWCLLICLELLLVK
jgi:U6 snRNA-associated Sm-like protein LSm8